MGAYVTKFLLKQRFGPILRTLASLVGQSYTPLPGALLVFPQTVARCPVTEKTQWQKKRWSSWKVS